MRRTMQIFAFAAWTAVLACSAVAAEPAAAVATPTPEATATPTAAEITSKMTGVVGELGKIKTDEPVQKQQKVILGELDLLIASLEKACSDCKGNMSNNRPRRPAAESTIRRGTGGIGDLVDPGQSEKDWAKLSPRERDRILQSMTEGFPPEYRTVLERYYRRLADEKAAPVAGAAAKAAKDETAETVLDKK